MLVQPTQDEGASSERLSDEQPSPSPAPTRKVPYEPHTDSSSAQPSEVPFEQQLDPSPRPLPRPSPRPSPTPIVPDSIPEPTDQAKEIKLLKAKITKLKKQAKPVIKHFKAYLKTVSLQQRLPKKSSSKKHRKHKESNIDHMETDNAQSEGRTREMVDEDKEIDEVRLVLEDRYTEGKDQARIEDRQTPCEKLQEQKRQGNQRNRPPTRIQLRNQMMTILKACGDSKHSELKSKKFEDIQAMYEKIKRSDEDFIAIGSVEDESLIKKMKKKDSSKGEEIKQESKEEVKEEDKDEENTRKRKHGTRKKMKSRKRRFKQDTSQDDPSDIEKENDELRLCLTIAPDEDKEVDYEVLDKKYPIIDWKTENLGTKPQFDESKRLEEINLNVVTRNKIPEGFDKVLWGDLIVMFNPDEQDEFWNSQHEWKVVSWKLHSSSGVHTLMTDEGLVVHMLIEKKYPLKKEILMQMLKLKLESEEESTMALELIRFIKKSWLVQDQTVLGKDYSNLLIADSLLKTIWFINAPCYDNEALASPNTNDEELSIPEQTATGKGTSNPLMAGSLPKTTKPTIMNPQEIQQVTAHDEKWVPYTERVKISTTNVRLETTVQQKEETFQVVIDIIKNFTCFKAFTKMFLKCLCSSSGTQSRRSNNLNLMNSSWPTRSALSMLKSTIEAHQHVCGSHSSAMENSSSNYQQVSLCKDSKENVDYPELIWEDFAFQIDHKKEKKSRRETMSFPRFTKVIINHFLKQHKSLSNLKYQYYHIIKDDESYQMFIKYSTSEIPPKKSRGKGSQGKKTVDVSQEIVDVSEESEPEPAKKRMASRKAVKKKVTISADDNIIPDPDVALELGKSISITKAKEEEAARQVHATHARIVTESVPEPAKKKTGSRSTISIVIQDTPSAPKLKPDASKIKLKGIPSLTPEEQLAADTIQALKFFVSY
ncbi:hypothetical protein Tco_0522341 [Tanacetum coccineum]